MGHAGAQGCLIVLVRVATVEDIPGILAMASVFIGESAYGMTFDKQKSEEYLQLLIEHPEVAVFVSDDVQAALISTISHDWCTQPVSYVEKLFVMPASRGTGASRMLVDAAVEFARQHGCSHIFTTATAGMGEAVERLYSNLFRKFDFSACGPVLFRSLHE